MARCVFAIDSAQYAGNFERALCAFVTGCIDPHLAQLGGWWGQIIKALPEADLAALAWAEELADFVPYDHYETMVHVIPTPGMWSDASGASCGQYNVAGEVPRRSSQPPYPVYNSVGIHFADVPSEAQIAQLCERALRFATAYTRERCHEIGVPRPMCVGGPIEILGFRVLKGRARSLRAFSPPVREGDLA